MLKCRVYLAQRQNLAQGTICIWSNPPTVGANTSCIAVERARLNLDALRSCTLLSLRTKKYRLNQVESESELVEWVGAVFGDKRETALGYSMQMCPMPMPISKLSQEAKSCTDTIVAERKLVYLLVDQVASRRDGVTHGHYLWLAALAPTVQESRIPEAATLQWHRHWHEMMRRAASLVKRSSKANVPKRAPASSRPASRQHPGKTPPQVKSWDTIGWYNTASKFLITNQVPENQNFFKASEILNYLLTIASTTTTAATTTTTAAAATTATTTATTTITTTPKPPASYYLLLRPTN